MDLIEEDERLTIEFAGGAKIIYRRLSPGKSRELRQRCTDRRTGLVDDGKLGAELISWCVVGWEGVRSHGVDVPFSPALLSKLPGDALGEVTRRINAQVLEDEAAASERL